jgi:hypothetical protein
MLKPLVIVALVGASLAARIAPAQELSGEPMGAPTADSLAALVMNRFASGTPDEFAAIFPDSAGRVFMRTRAPKQANIAQVIWRAPRRAVLLLAGTTRGGAGSDQTNNARHFSGFYGAVEANGVWTVAHKIPFDSANYIRSQAITVDIVPATGIHVVDTLTLTIGAPYGFGFRINNDVKFASVRLDGTPVRYAFGGGVVWFPAPRRPNAKLVLEYSLAAERRSDTTSVPAFGAFHNTDMWHPAFDYISANHLAQITVTARIPAEYQLTTTIPQTVSVRDGVRTVRGRSMHAAFLLALIFDREWQPRVTDFGSFRFESFLTPRFRHSHDTLAARTKHLHDLLAQRFGEPQAPSRYLVAVEDRALAISGGFNVRMNNAAISGGGGGTLGSENGQVFAHETGHAWTMNASGRGSNFLHEAWAKFVESLVLRDLFGEAAELNYWEAQRNNYMVGNDRSGWNGGFEGRQSILGDFDNGRIHYMKGSWILRSANWAMGDSAFDRGMRDYIAGMGTTPGGYEEFIAALSRSAGHPMDPFVMPWLTSRYIPDVDARVDGARLIVTQSQPGELFDLPKLEVELVTPAGRIVRTVHLRTRADSALIGSVGPVSEVRVDPNHRYLLQRHWGEVVRFELPVTALPSAQSVQLASTFLRQGVTLPATRVGDQWVVDVPLTEGRYIYIWSAANPAGRSGAAGASSADPALTGTRVVRPLQRIDNAYPGR